MLTSTKYLKCNLNELPESSFWSNGSNQELKMHKIHAYPAKFRAFLVLKSLEFAKNEGVDVKSVADIFCGCGTTALEAKRLNIDFWGCDINPVATLITKVKSEQYSQNILEKYFRKILETYSDIPVDTPAHYHSNDRLIYWFPKEQINDLYKLLTAIRYSVPRGKYRDFFLCALSNILKGTSRWLTKSIKPQIDNKKIPQKVNIAFEIQFDLMAKANQEARKAYNSKSKTRILTINFLEAEINNPFVDLLITSPPYVTSYEYADLHQLSTLWLGYTNDYRFLRQGTIGSLYFSKTLDAEAIALNEVGQPIFQQMLEIDKSKAMSIAKYFLDINSSIKKVYSILNSGALSIIVIGNTKYRGIEVNNAKFITKCMIDVGFSEIKIFKRKVGPKFLTPYRDLKGRFSRDETHRKVYSHEFILTAKKP